MLFNLNNDEGSLDTKQYDVCVCGTGPAGVTVARTLAKHGKTVVLLEGGDLEYTDESQAIYQGDSVGEEYWNGVEDNRLRFFGGTSNHWTGRCALFNQADFESRSYHGLPGWPIALQDMHNYLDEAASILDLPKNSFSKKAKMVGSGFEEAVKEMSAPTRFGEKYSDELSDSDKIDVIYNANLNNIQLHTGYQTVKSFDVVNFSGGKFKVRANQYVIAMGAIENPRILLNSNSQVRGGIGNQNDMVGRCFMEHLNIAYGRFVIDKGKDWGSDPFQVSITADAARKMEIGNGIVSFQANADVRDYGRLRKLKATLRDVACESDLAKNMFRNLVDYNCPGDGVIGSLIEQVPNLNSRIKLSSTKDSIGLRRVILDWEIDKKDIITIRTIGAEVAKAMAISGMARVQLRDYILNKKMKIPHFGAHAHQMGTTRMSNSPKYGVVDENSKVHGISNLYVAGSSVFSTGGGVNPTISIVMLSLRLGVHLSMKVKGA